MVSGSFTSSRAAGKPRTPMLRRSLGSYVSTVLRVADAGTVYWLPSMKVHLTTLGCPKNQVDSELMLGMLTEAGFPLAERAEDAECVIVNTCAFIDRARQESVDTILELAKLKEHGSCRALIVTGCLTQRYGGDILKEMPQIDGLLGTSNLSRIVQLVRPAAGRHDW